MKYKHEHMPMKAIGELFGVSSHQIGKWLTGIGLRESDGKPSSRAYAEGFIEQRFFKDCFTNYWNTEKTVFELEKAGHRKINNLPEKYVEHGPIKGPFTIRKNINNGYDILNEDGSTAFTVYGQENATRVEKFFSVSSKHPKFLEFFPSN